MLPFLEKRPIKKVSIKSYAKEEIANGLSATLNDGDRSIQFFLARSDILTVLNADHEPVIFSFSGIIKSEAILSVLEFFPLEADKSKALRYATFKSLNKSMKVQVPLTIKGAAQMKIGLLSIVKKRISMRMDGEHLFSCLDFHIDRFFSPNRRKLSLLDLKAEIEDERVKIIDTTSVFCLLRLTSAERRALQKQ
jgi:hypothetical protein